MKVKRDERKRIWKSVLGDLVRRNPPEFTVEDLVEEEEEEGLTSASASQLVSRLRQWGYIRLTGFAPAVGGIGRQKHVYEVTEKAKKKCKGKS